MVDRTGAGVRMGAACSRYICICRPSESHESVPRGMPVGSIKSTDKRVIILQPSSRNETLLMCDRHLPTS
jgi:hypothetical protein